ncbi:Chitinase class I [Fragilaria crotonensis]|nr:Chitinase class I [Fragilaria crotonensis]
MFPNFAWGTQDGNSTKNLRGSDSSNNSFLATPDEPIHHRHLAACGGGSRGNGVCSDGTCCSQYGWCGTTAEHCKGTGGSPCGGGNRGNGVCNDGTCCSQYGWCGTTAAHCGPTPPAPTGSRPTPPASTPTGGGSFPINSSARTLTIADVQAGLDRYNSLQGGNQRATQSIVDQINAATRGYSVYRQLALVAHTIWESGGYQFREELAAINPPFTNRANYQDCDWSAPGTQFPANGKFFYGRGYMQLSWCANYRAYGRARMVNGDPEYFYKNPELVATTYAMDSAAWYFDSNVKDNSGSFGLTTKDINGQLECNGGSARPAKRYAIFEALAKKVGMTGYNSGGC